MDLHTAPSQPTPSDCAELLLLVPEYSIGAASAEEAALIERNLDRCPELAAEVSAYRQVADTLLHSFPVTSAPPAVLDRLMAQIEGEKHLAPLSGSSLRSDFGSTPFPPLPEERGNNIPSFIEVSTPADAMNRVPTTKSNDSTGNQRVVILTRWLAAAVALLIISNVFWAVMFARQQTAPPAPGVLEAADANWLALTSVNEIPASAVVVWSPSREKAWLLAHNFPVQPPDMGYQAWLRRDDQLYSLGVFQVGEDGSGILELEADILNGPITNMGITNEPVGGSPGPTGSAVVRLRVPSS